MRICFLYNSILRHGGVQRVVARLANAFSQEHDVEILCNEPIDLSANPYGLALDRIHVFHEPLIPKWPNRWLRLKRAGVLTTTALAARLRLQSQVPLLGTHYYDSRIRRRAAELINRRRYDVVVGCLMPFNLLLGSISHDVDCALLGWENNSYDWYINNDRLFIRHRELHSALLRRLDGFVTLTHYDQRMFERATGVRATVIPNAVSFSSEQKSSGNQKTILAVGRLEAIKGTDLLIEAFKLFLRDGKDWTLTIVGEGAGRPMVEEDLKASGIADHVRLVSFTSDVMSHYLQSSVYVCASRYESFGLAPLEAMECGLPVVTFDTSGPAELVRNGIDGLVVPAFDARQLAEAMSTLASDDALRLEMARNACLRAREYTTERIVGEWNRIFALVGEGRQPCGPSRVRGSQATSCDVRSESRWS